MNDMNSSNLLGSTGAGGDLTQRFSLDVQGFDGLRRAAHTDPKAAEKAVAKQVDATFLSMMLKSMRDATPQDGLLDSQNGKTYTSMLDGQMTQELSNKGVGLADTLLKQMDKQQHNGTQHLGSGLKDGAAFDAAGVGAAQHMAQHAPAPRDMAAHEGHARSNDGVAGISSAAARAMQAAALANAAYSSSGSSGAGSSAGGGMENMMGGGMAAELTAMASAAGKNAAGQNVGAQNAGLSALQALSMQGAAPGASMTPGMPANAVIGARLADMNMYERSKLTTQERVAAVEAAAMQAGWRPSHGTEVSPLAGNVRSQGGIPAGGLDRGQAFGLAAAGGAEGAKPIQMRGASERMNGFLERLTPAAEAASRETGIPAHFILSQIALESGWGKSEIRSASGERTHNVLGVKAGEDWKGPTVTATTTEYINGRPHRMNEKFRVYGSYREALKDYADVLTGNQRYAQALRGSQTASGFAHGMQRAGYATDPNYARKLMAIIKQMV